MKTELQKISVLLEQFLDTPSLLAQTTAALSVKHGHTNKWQAVLDVLSELPSGGVSIKQDAVFIALTIDETLLISNLKQLIPWRKGPYQFGELKLDSEWNGGMKWARLQPHIGSLQGKKVLDVGCGNGYFSYQMALAGAEFVLGLEPFLLFNYQFYAVQKLIKTPLNICVLPLRLEALPPKPRFDVVFSMGVLYHQKSPIEHLQQLKQQLKPGGKLILETLIVEGELGYALLPKDRYAQMRNVWFLPSIATLLSYLTRCGFKNSVCVDSNQTTLDEQKNTKWLGDNTASLVDFLNPKDNNQTTEGYPAPRRAIFVCS